VKLIVRPFDIKGRLKHGEFKREIFSLAFGRHSVRADAQFLDPRHVSHETGHQSHHHVLDVQLQRQARIGQRALDSDALNGCGIIKVSRLDLRLVQNRKAQEIAQAGIRTQHWQGRARRLRTEHFFHSLQLVSSLPLPWRRDPFAADQHKRGERNAARQGRASQQFRWLERLHERSCIRTNHREHSTVVANPPGSLVCSGTERPGSFGRSTNVSIRWDRRAVS